LLGGRDVGALDLHPLAHPLLEDHDGGLAGAHERSFRGRTDVKVASGCDSMAARRRWARSPARSPAAQHCTNLSLSSASVRGSAAWPWVTSTRATRLSPSA